MQRSWLTVERSKRGAHPAVTKVAESRRPRERCLSGSTSGRANPLVARPHWRAGPTQPSVWTTEGWLSLAVVLDLYSRAVIGWALEARLTGDPAQQVLTMALHHHASTAGLLHHSDRGSQSAATTYQQLLTTYEITGRLSRRGNCWDHACVESCFGTRKRELIHQRQYRTWDEATQDIFEYIRSVL